MFSGKEFGETISNNICNSSRILNPIPKIIFDANNLIPTSPHQSGGMEKSDVSIPLDDPIISRFSVPVFILQIKDLTIFHSQLSFKVNQELIRIRSQGRLSSFNPSLKPNLSMEDVTKNFLIPNLHSICKMENICLKRQGVIP